jgi:hypothetical protein
VKTWRAALLAAALCLARGAGAADDLNAAARDLARRTAAAVGRGDAVAVSWRNISTLGSGEAASLQLAFSAALREAGARENMSAMAPPARASITISDTPSSYLLIEEMINGDQRHVWILSSPRPSALPAAGINLEKRLLWEQDEPILDIATVEGSLLVLTPSALIRVAPRQRAPIMAAQPLPRDPRGRLRVNGPTVHAHLPGVSCSGTIEPALTLTCNPSDEPWTLESGSRALLLANFAANRNYFDGRVVTQTGARKTVPPFYSAAAVFENLTPFWILATVDGRAEIFDAAMDPAGAAGQTWGSDIATTDSGCGGRSIVLATHAGDGPESIQAFVFNRALASLGEPLELLGPVTALWSSGVAVVRNAATGKFQAYAITVPCAL